MVPVFAKGFEDLKKRVDEQDAAIKGTRTYLRPCTPLWLN